MIITFFAALVWLIWAASKKTTDPDQAFGLICMNVWLAAFAVIVAVTHG